MFPDTLTTTAPEILTIVFLNILAVIKVLLQLMHKRNALKGALQFLLIMLRHISVQSHHHQGTHCSCLLQLHLLK